MLEILPCEQDDAVSDQLPRTWAAVRGAFAATIGRHNLSLAQWRLLAMLYEGGPTTQSELALRTRLDKVAVSRASQYISRIRLVNRVAHNRDGRSHHLTLTARGEEVYQQIQAEAAEFERRLLDGLAGSDIALLKGFLRCIDGAATAAVGEDAVEEHRPVRHAF